jgi:hypothetical protein
VDVVGEEDCTDMKSDEVYRPSCLSIKTENEVSLLIECFLWCLSMCACIVTCFFGGAGGWGKFYIIKTAILSLLL